jgi:ABC-type multidrug transport system permease subunit
VWVLGGLVALFWIGLALLLSLRARHYLAGAVAGVLGGAIIFFIGGGLASVRLDPSRVIWVAWLFPNTYAVDPLRDLVLFRTMPTDWGRTLAILGAFAVGSLAVTLLAASRQLRRA